MNDNVRDGKAHIPHLLFLSLFLPSLLSTPLAPSNFTISFSTTLIFMYLSLLISHSLLHTHTHTQISTTVLKQLVEKIRETLQSLESSDDVALTKTHFENILEHTKLVEGNFYEGVEF